MKTIFFIYSKWLLSLALLLWQGTALAQTPAIVWQKSFGGSGVNEAYAIQQTTDGGYIVAGGSSSNDGDVTGNHGGDDFWIVKLDANSTLAWQKCLGGSDDDVATTIQQTTDGGYIVAGESRSYDGEVTGNHGSSDFWIVKLEANGNLAWQKCLGRSYYDRATAIQQCTDGGYIVVGESDANGDGDYDYLIAKLDAEGRILWQKILGGSNSEGATAIQQCTDGGYIVAGYSGSIDGDVIGNHGDFDYWIVKLDANGNLAWQKSLGGSRYDWATAIQQTIDGGYIVAGYSFSIDGEVTGTHGDGDYWIVKLDAYGNLDWQQCLGGSRYDWANAIQQTTDGSYIVAGYSRSLDGEVTGNKGFDDYWIVKIDEAGNLLWQKSLGGSMLDWANAIEPCKDGGYIVAGWSESIDGDISENYGVRDVWIVKLKEYVVGTSGLGGLIVFPNPVVGNTMQVEYYLSLATPVEMRIIDVLGRCVWCESAELEEIGVHSPELDVEGLASGLYFLEIRTKYGRATVRWVKG